MKKRKTRMIKLLTIPKLNSMEVFSHNELVLINIILKEYNEMKEEIKTLKT